jgi:hypothetical protein
MQGPFNNDEEIQRTGLSISEYQLSFARFGVIAGAKKLRVLRAGIIGYNLD